MLAFLDEHRSPKNIDQNDPRVKLRKQLQTVGNAKISDRQRPVLPEGYQCALWSFQVPWAPFDYYLNNPCNETKPFLWTAPFPVANSEWMLFMGVEPMEAENRTSLWIAICNNLNNQVTAYTKMDVVVPSASPEVDVQHIGDAVDTLNSCGQVFQQNKFGRFWWHKSPQDFQRCLFRGVGDSGHEQSFELLLTVKLDVKNPAERSPARDEDPKLWETSSKYLQPWVTSRAAAVVEPYELRIRDLEMAVQKEKERGHQALRSKETEASEALRLKDREITDAQKREQDALSREQAATRREEAATAKTAKLDALLADAHTKEEQLKKSNASLEARIKDGLAREEQLKAHSAGLENKLREAQVREGELRKWGQSLQQLLKESKDREDHLSQEKARLEEYIKNTTIREERLQNEIRKLEMDVKNGKLSEQYLVNTVQKLQLNVNDYQEREEVLRNSNGRLYEACTDERHRAASMSQSPHDPNSPPRIRALASPLGGRQMAQIPPPTSPANLAHLH